MIKDGAEGGKGGAVITEFSKERGHPEWERSREQRVREILSGRDKVRMSTVC